MITSHALARRLAGYAEQYQGYVAALAETPTVDLNLRAATVAKWKQVEDDLRKAAELLGFKE